MAGEVTSKTSGSRVETRSAANKTDDPVGPERGNKLGFIKTTGTGKRRSISDPVRASGTGKRKSVTDPEPREYSRQKMSTNNGTSLPSAAESAKSSGKTSKLPLKPSKLAGASKAANPVDAGGAGCVGGQTPGNVAPERGSCGGGGEDEGSRELQIAIHAFKASFGAKLDEITESQKTFGEKIDKIQETLGVRVAALEEKIENVEEMLEKNDRQVDELTKKVDLIPVDIRRGVATAVAKETGAINEGIKELRDRQDALEAAVASKEDCNPGKDCAPPGRRPRRLEHLNEKSSRYWEARKCAKMSPIDGDTEEDMISNVSTFIYKVLKVDEEDFDMSSVKTVRRIKSFGTSKIEKECLVMFEDVERRDYVYSHARNLAGQDLKDGKRESNLRMQVPAHLLECFRTLDKHGHVLKMKYEKKGRKIKRHVNYDDESESLYLDIKLSKDDPWERVYPDVAREERREREKRMSRSRKKPRTTSTIDTSTSEDSNDDDPDAHGSAGTSRR